MTTAKGGESKIANQKGNKQGNALDVLHEVVVIGVERSPRVESHDEERQATLLPVVRDGNADRARRRVTPRPVLESVRQLGREFRHHDHPPRHKRLPERPGRSVDTGLVRHDLGMHFVESGNEKDHDE